MTFTKALVAILLISSTASLQAESLFDRSRAERLPLDSGINLGPFSNTIRYDKRMIRAAQIAQARARAHSVSRCWRYVKDALVSADVVSDRPKTEYAKQAGNELTTKYGFRKVNVKDPYRAPVGSVLVYGGRGPGHVELRTASGFVSDFTSPTPSKRPLIGVYVKPRS